MTKKYDLHCHSTASDGVLTPTELVQRAHEQGINVLALCDHDTVMGIDEAKIEADKLGIENISINVSQDEYIKALPKVIYHLDDPVADPSQVGIYFLSKEAKKHVTVVLSGEGADELFGGYNIYKEYKQYSKFSQK